MKIDEIKTDGYKLNSNGTVQITWPIKLNPPAISDKSEKNTTPTSYKKSSVRWIISCLSILVFLLIWYLATGPLELISPIKFPSPEDTYDGLKQLTFKGYADGNLIQHILSSTELVLWGFLVATITGVPLGLLMGQYRMIDALINPVFQIIRPIAPIAWIPLTILWFGLGTEAKVFVIWLAAVSPAVINTYTGVRNIDNKLIEAAYVNGASGRQMLWEVVIPGALPLIFTGLRTSLQACWMVLVAAELVGSFIGLGHILIIATRDLNSAMILVAMTSISVMGISMSFLLTYIERKMIPWKQ